MHANNRTGAAQRFPDKVDKDPEAARALNVSATRSLASAAAARNIFVLYISTDYVFSGRPGEAPYDVDAKTGPTNFYGQTKLDGEHALLEEMSKSQKQGLGVVLRVPVLYGKAEVPAESAVNVLMDSVWKAQTEGTKIKMDHWALRFPTNTEDVARVCYGEFQRLAFHCRGPSLGIFAFCTERDHRSACINGTWTNVSVNRRDCQISRG